MIRTPFRHRRRKGASLLLFAALLVMLLGFVALAVDTGYMFHVRCDLQRSVDAAARAGAGAMIEGTGKGRQEAIKYLESNPVGDYTLHESDADIEFGVWNEVTRSFTPTHSGPNAIKVTASSNTQPLFFASVWDKYTFSTQASAICISQPRDIVLVLDYSGSMAFDSQFRNLGLLGQSQIEASMQQMYGELNSPHYGSLTFAPVAYGTSSTSTADVIAHFGLSNVPYPYPGGSWSEYVRYVQTDSYINAAGYRNKYGYLTWINYLQSQRCTHGDTPELYKTSEQPVTSLKDAVDVFISYLQQHTTHDRVGLAIYTAGDGTAILESHLTQGLPSIANICRHRQAAHYTGGTNISAGMTKARIELEQNARVGSRKMMLLMTDGVVNLPYGSSSANKQAVLNEANLAKADGLPIITIALGAYADTALMKQVADITGGVTFVIPGGQSVEMVKAQLEEVFRQVAAVRPLKLVQ